MSDPSLAMQKLMVTRLKAHAGVTALVGQRIYDRVPESAQFPFIQIGYFQIVDDSADCVDSVECYIELQAWSRAVGQVEAKEIASAVRAALHNYAAALDEPYALVGNIEHQSSRPQGDADGITTRIIVNFKALVEKP